MARYTKLALKTGVLFLFDDVNYRIWRLSRRAIAFMQKLLLKPVLGSDQNIEELKCFLNLKIEANSQRLWQNCSFCSTWHNQSYMLGRRVGDNWCYYSPYLCMQILGREYQVLRQSPQLIHLVNNPTSLKHDLNLQGGRPMRAVLSVTIAYDAKRAI